MTDLKRRAQAAKRELPETEAVLGAMRAQAVADTFRSEPGDTATRERLYATVQIIDHVILALKSAVNAQEAIDEVEAQKTKASEAN